MAAASALALIPTRMFGLSEWLSGLDGAHHLAKGIRWSGSRPERISGAIEELQRIHARPPLGAWV